MKLILKNSLNSIAVCNGENNPLTNEFALAYYNKMKLRNGNVDLDTVSIFGLSLSDYKTALNNFFENLEFYGLFTMIKCGYILLGNDKNVVAVNFVDPEVYEGSFTGSPSVTSSGVEFDGVNDSFDTTFPNNAFNSADDNGLTIELVSSNMSTNDPLFSTGIWPSKVSAYNDGIGRFVFKNLSGNVTADTKANGIWTSEKSDLSFDLYKNGSNVNSVSSPSDDTANSSTIKLAVEDSLYSEFKSGFFICHDYLGVTGVSDLINCINTFKTVLGL